MLFILYQKPRERDKTVPGKQGSLKLLSFPRGSTAFGNAANNYSKAQNLSVLDPYYEYKKLLYSYCKDSAGLRIGTSIRDGAIVGGASGAFAGFVFGELFGGEVSLGTTGVPGAYFGVHIGGVVGAIRGLDTGLLSAGACALLGAY